MTQMRFPLKLQDWRPLNEKLYRRKDYLSHTTKAKFFWSKESRVALGFIQPGKPTQNTFVDGLNGKFRDESLNLNWFRTLSEAKSEIDLWREHYNHVRPHSSLN
jgi:putative transposase